MIDEKYKKAADFAVSGIEAIKRTGIRVLEMRDRYAKFLMPLEGNVNHVGMMYAGSLFTIGEFTGGIIFGASFDYNKFFPIVKEVNIRFRRPAMTDVTIEVELSKEEVKRIQKEAEEKGKADFTLDLEIKDVQGETVSLVHGIWQMRKIPEGMESPFPK
ncbi:MAG: YiiD C-terminal domain-containing protein [Deltaproteobacteria bacterium]|nr:YiiD C-terminal domain-containing protein [Deltaproteobacteria bacterium]